MPGIPILTTAQETVTVFVKSTDGSTPLIVGLIGVMVGSILTGVVSGFFRYLELRFNTNLGKRKLLLAIYEDLYILFLALSDEKLQSRWLDDRFRMDVNALFNELHKKAVTTKSLSFNKSIEIYDYLWHRIRLEVMKPYFDNPNEMPANLNVLTTDMKAKLILMQTVINLETDSKSIVRLLLGNYFSFLKSVFKSGGVTLGIDTQHKIVFDEMRKYLNNNGVE